MKPWLTILCSTSPCLIPLKAPGENPPVIEKDPVEMVIVHAGTFIRGSAAGEGRLDEQPKRKIYLKGFAIDKYEVSNARYREFLEETLHKPPFNVYGDGPLSAEGGVDDLPVVQVTWHDAWTIVFGQVNAFQLKPNGKRQPVAAIRESTPGAMNHPHRKEPSLIESGLGKIRFEKSRAFQRDNLPLESTNFQAMSENGPKIGTMPSITRIVLTETPTGQKLAS